MPSTAMSAVALSQSTIALQLPYSDLMRGVALNRDKMEGLPTAFAVIRKEDGNTLLFFDRAPTRGGQMQLPAVRFEDVLL